VTTAHHAGERDDRPRRHLPQGRAADDGAYTGRRFNDTEIYKVINLINQRLVLGNQVLFGSVNACHFAQGVTDLAAIERTRPGALGGLLTTPIPWDACRTWFDERGGAWRPANASTLSPPRPSHSSGALHAFKV
jgi:hypothetical protein